MATSIDNFLHSLKSSLSNFQSIDNARPLWIFGAGGFGKALCQAMLHHGIKVSGFVETSPQINSVLDLPIVEWAELKRRAPNAQLALGILNRGAPYDKLIQIAQSAGFLDMLMPWETYDLFGKELGWRFWLSTRDFLLSGLDQINAVAARLSDEESKQTLARITAFRLGLDNEYASVQSANHQYFNDITLRSLRNKPMVFVDCGAYNGDTYFDLIAQQDIICQQAFLMEPDHENFMALVANVSKHSKVQDTVCLPLAAAEKYSMLSFSSGQGEGGAIGINGNTNIAAVALDELMVNTPVDFIKLDVEGAEAQVINGARQLIHRCRPVLALSLYHNPQDIWVLPELLFEVCEDYSFYVRQHYFNSFDSVLYAVPNKRSLS